VGDLSVHLLDIVVSVVLELLLALSLNLEFVNSGLQVSGSRKSAGNSADMVSLFSSKFE
jgi:hypothetical protein